MKIFKFSVIFLCITFSVGFVITAAMLIKQNMVDIMINDNVNSMAHNIKYRNPLKISGVPKLAQKINCGYVCIEMLSEYLVKIDADGSDSETIIVTEDMLSEENNGRNSASTSGGFYAEIKKQFPEYKVTQHKNLKNSELIEKIYESLSNDMPVIFSYAALEKPDKTTKETEKTEKKEPSWTLHYGIVTAMNLPEDKITVNNPYGSADTYTLTDFLRATRFENYENMEFYLKLGFAVEIFTKNTAYIFERHSDDSNNSD